MSEFSHQSPTSGVSFGEIDPEAKWRIVAAVDFGTTFSGVTIAFKDFPNEMYHNAPGISDPTDKKTPTVLLLHDTSASWEAGRKAISTYGRTNGQGHLFQAFKMALHRKTENFGIEVKAVNSEMTIPLMTLYVEYLKNILACTLSTIRSCGHQSVLYRGKTNTAILKDIKWVITVPAMWTEFAKAFTRRAAYLAGFVENEYSPDLVIALESEAATLNVYSDFQHTLEPGSLIAVADSGGGTFDLTVSRVAQTYPLKLEVAAAPAGGAFGGDRVNDNFKAYIFSLMRPIVNLANDIDRAHLQGLFLQFEEVKKRWNPDTHPDTMSLNDLFSRHLGSEGLRLLLDQHSTTPERSLIQVREDRYFLRLSKQQMKSFFEPMVSEIIAESIRVLNENPGVSTYIMVGGFSESAYLETRVREALNLRHPGLNISCNRDTAQLAVCYGGVLYGLYSGTFSDRVAPYHIGISVSGKFKPLCRQDSTIPNGKPIKKGDRVPFEFTALPLLALPVRDEDTWVKFTLLKCDHGTEPPRWATDAMPLGEIAVQVPTSGEDKAMRAEFQFSGGEIGIKVYAHTSNELINKEGDGRICMFH